MQGRDAYLPAVAARSLSALICPSDGQQPLDPYSLPANEFPTSNYSSVMGPGRDGQVAGADSEQCGRYATDGVIYPKSKTQIAHIRDGTTNTLLVGERINELRVWTKGAAIDSSKACVYQSKNVRWSMNQDINDLCYRGTYRTCPSGSTSLKFNDAEFGSRHPGGAHFALADGSVQFVSGSIELTILQNLATRAGGELATLP